MVTGGADFIGIDMVVFCVDRLLARPDGAKMDLITYTTDLFWP